MAIWQYTFHKLPLDSVAILSDGNFLYGDDEGLDDELFWKKYPYKKTIFNGIDSILKKTNRGARISIYMVAKSQIVLKFSLMSIIM